MGNQSDEHLPDGTEKFSLVRGDRFFRIQRAIGLIPADGGLGVGRRAVFLALVTWLPVAVWAYLTGRALPGRVNEPLLQHFGVHVRCLVAIPLFIVGEATVHAASTHLVPYFLSSGLPRGRAVHLPYLGIDADRHDYLDATFGVRVAVWRSVMLSLGVFKALNNQGVRPDGWSPVGTLEATF